MMYTQIDKNDPEQVAWLQTALTKLLASPPPMYIGTFDPLVQKALRIYQSTNGLPITGEPDAATLQHINAALAA